MPLWKSAVLAFLAIPRCACVEGDGDPEQHNEGDGEPEQDNEEVTSLSVEQLHNLHSKMDLDSNGKVSLDEVMSFSFATQKQMAFNESAQVLEDGDSDKDGKLSLVEYLKEFIGEAFERKGDNKFKEEMAKEENKFKAADADGDGFLSAVELLPRLYPEIHEGSQRIAAQSTLKQKDADKDGLLTAEEFLADDPEDGPHFAKMDKDGNGRLSLEELFAWESGDYHTMEAMETFIETADKDKDLHVTSEEIVAAYDSMVDSDAHATFLDWAQHHEL